VLVSETQDNFADCEHRHVTVLQLRAAEDAPGFTTFFQPEGGERFIRAGDRLTVAFDTAEPREIDLAMNKDSSVFWRPTSGDVRVAIVDRRTGDELPISGGGAMKVWGRLCHRSWWRGRPGECGGEVCCPGPGFGDAQPGSAAVVGDPGSGV
jgi:hypothetical protein